MQNNIFKNTGFLKNIIFTIWEYDTSSFCNKKKKIMNDFTVACLVHVRSFKELVFEGGERTLFLKFFFFFYNGIYNKFVSLKRKAAMEHEN